MTCYQVRQRRALGQHRRDQHRRTPRPTAPRRATPCTARRLSGSLTPPATLLRHGRRTVTLLITQCPCVALARLLAVPPACLAGGGAMGSGLQVAPIVADLAASTDTPMDCGSATPATDRYTRRCGCIAGLRSMAKTSSRPRRSWSSARRCWYRTGRTQLVRVIRIGAPPLGSDAKEAAYRLSHGRAAVARRRARSGPAIRPALLGSGVHRAAGLCRA